MTTHPLTLSEFQALRNCIVTGQYEYAKPYVDKLTTANLLNEPLIHPEYEWQDFQSFRLIDATIFYMKDFKKSYDFISYIFARGGTPDVARASLISRTLISKYASSICCYGGSIGGYRILCTLEDLRRHFNPLPHEYIGLFVPLLDDVSHLNIYKIIDCADYKLFKMIVDKGFKLDSFILDHAIKRANERIGFVVEEPRDICGMGYDGTTLENYYISDLYVEIVHIIIDAGVREHTVPNKNEKIAKLLRLEEKDEKQKDEKRKDEKEMKRKRKKRKL